METEFQRLRGEASRGEATLLDRYGASNRAEFFAVASECFFERPAPCATGTRNYTASWPTSTART